jgi:hypothetical protein
MVTLSPTSTPAIALQAAVDRAEAEAAHARKEAYDSDAKAREAAARESLTAEELATLEVRHATWSGKGAPARSF